MKKIVVLASGNGTNLQAIIDSINNKELNCTIAAVVCNIPFAKAVERAQKNNILTVIPEQHIERKKYDDEMGKLVSKYSPDLVVLAGWMRILTCEFLKYFPNKVINLHPGLPGKIKGANAIEDAFNRFQQENNDTQNGLSNENVDYSGVMCHYVIEEVDAGETICSLHIPIFKEDTLEKYRTRVQKYEKTVLLTSMKLLLNEGEHEPNFYKGKVRNVYTMNDKVLAMVQTNRLSAFDRNISQISDKGAILTKTSEWWFNKLEADLNIPHHHLYTHDNVMFVKKCNVIPLEVVIRDYMTGSTKTSLWTHYKNGSRNYSGNLLRDGYVKNQKLDDTIVTPTTKGVVDVPISETEILEQNIVSKEQWDYMKTTALKVFHYGSKVARERGLILVDTKYEFGFDENGDILLIDEVHTCDSSRFWKLDTYEELFNNGQEPKKFDKDIIRDYVKKQYDDPYKDQINIPDSMKKTTRFEYIKFYELLTEAKFSSEHLTRFNNKLCKMENIELDMIDMDYLNQLYSYYFPCCIILSGSDKDEKHVNKIKYELQDRNIHNVDYVCSAHKNTGHLLDLLNKYETSNNKIIYITVAGKSDALSGVVSANAQFPVIACPPHHNKLDMLTNLNSTLQCPSYVPALTCLNPINVALCCKKILAFI
tara:strand:- start:9762 stop:11711 length:1950 start_codon:yes stop_codon:yes gene_type:complete